MPRTDQRRAVNADAYDAHAEAWLARMRREGDFVEVPPAPVAPEVATRAPPRAKRAAKRRRKVRG